MNDEAYLIAHNIRSAHNVGSLFRTADAAGVSRIYLVGSTPAPSDRFGRTRQDICKTALGAEQSIPWESSADVVEVIQRLRASGATILALEKSARSVSHREYKIKGAFAIIVGNEISGIPSDILDLCDAVLEIRQLGKKESLNVSVAAGIALYTLLGL